MSVLPSPRIDVPHVPILRHFTPEMEATLLKSAAWHPLVLVFSSLSIPLLPRLQNRCIQLLLGRRPGVSIQQLILIWAWVQLRTGFQMFGKTGEGQAVSPAGQIPQKGVPNSSRPTSLQQSITWTKRRQSTSRWCCFCGQLFLVGFNLSYSAVLQQSEMFSLSVPLKRSQV